MSGQWWGLALSAAGVAGFLLAGRRVWWAWHVNLAAQALWATWAVTTGQYGFLAGTAVYTAVFGRNAWLWARRHREAAHEHAHRGWRP